MQRVQAWQLVQQQIQRRERRRQRPAQPYASSAFVLRQTQRVQTQLAAKAAFEQARHRWRRVP